MSYCTQLQTFGNSTRSTVYKCRKRFHYFVGKNDVANLFQTEQMLFFCLQTNPTLFLTNEFLNSKRVLLSQSPTEKRNTFLNIPCFMLTTLMLLKHPGLYLE